MTLATRKQYSSRCPKYNMQKIGFLSRISKRLPWIDTPAHGPPNDAAYHSETKINRGETQLGSSDCAYPAETEHRVSCSMQFFPVSCCGFRFLIGGGCRSVSFAKTRQSFAQPGSGYWLGSKRTRLSDRIGCRLCLGGRGNEFLGAEKHWHGGALMVRRGWYWVSEGAALGGTAAYPVMFPEIRPGCTVMISWIDGVSRMNVLRVWREI